MIWTLVTFVVGEIRIWVVKNDVVGGIRECACCADVKQVCKANEGNEVMESEEMSQVKSVAIVLQGLIAKQNRMLAWEP